MPARPSIGASRGARSARGAGRSSSLCVRGVPGVWQRERATRSSDVGLYRATASAIARGQVPYRDFDVEYPPGALPCSSLPALVTDSRARTTRVRARPCCSALVGCVGVVLVDSALAALGRARRERRPAPGGSSRSRPSLLGALLLTRFDLLPAALTSAAAARCSPGATGSAGLVARRRDRGEALPARRPAARARVGRGAGAGGARRSARSASRVAVPALVFLPVRRRRAGRASRGASRQQLGRPLQIESLGAAVLLALHHAAGHDARVVVGSRLAEPDGQPPRSRSRRRVLRLGVARVRRGGARCTARPRLGGTARPGVVAAAVVAFVALGKVLSPQFLIWLALPRPASSPAARAGSRWR